MSGVAVARYILANAAGVLALVPAARISAGVLPINTALPAISVTQISGTERWTVAMTEASRYKVERVQVTVLAKTYPSQKAVLTAIRAALYSRAGTVNGVKVDSILPAGEGPDLHDADAQIHEQSQDFFVRYLT